MKNIFLHIGFHKTGTSALQEMLCRLRDSLEQCDVFYPLSFGEKLPSHADFAWMMAQRMPKWSSVPEEKKQEVVDCYLDQIRDTECPNVIISGEDFCSFQLAEIRNLRKIFSGQKVYIIAYLREPKSFIASLYSHAVRVGKFRGSFDEYLDDSSVFNIRCAAYRDRLKSWIDVFKKENMIVKEYSGNLECDFLSIFGVEIDDPPTAQRVNEGVHPVMIGIYRNFLSLDVSSQYKKILLNEIKQISKSLPKVDAFDYLASDNHKTKVESFLVKCNEQLYEDFGIDFR